MTVDRADFAKVKARTFVTGLTSHLSALLRSNSGLVPLANRKYSLQLGSGPVIEGTTDDDGYLQHLDVPPGDYTLTIDDVTSVVPTVSNPNERPVVRVRSYFLVQTGFWYTVQEGDSLSKIAQRFKVEGGWQAIYQHDENSTFRQTHTDPNLIYPGDRIWVPGPDEAAREPAENDADAEVPEDAGFYYTIESGDSLSKLAERFDVPGGWRAIYYHDENEDLRETRTDPNLIHPGDEIWIPAPDLEEDESED